MSGNAKQRRQERTRRELVELGRGAKEASDRHAAEAASMRDRYERELAEVQQRYQVEVESWARASRSDAEVVARLRADVEEERRRARQLQDELDEIKRTGLITRREHEAAVEQATAQLRERLRRKSEERLAPKKILIDHTQEERRLREALARQRENFRAIVTVSDVIKPEGLRAMVERCVVEIGGALGERA